MTLIIVMIVLCFLSAGVAFFLAHTNTMRKQQKLLIFAGFGLMAAAIGIATSLGPYLLLAVCVIVPVWIVAAVIAPGLVRRLKMDSA